MKALLIPAIILIATPAAAQEWPDLIGVWKGTSRAVVGKASGHYGNVGDVAAGEVGKFVSAELTIEWVKQDDGRYIGSITSASHTEPKLGIVSGDGKSLFTVDSDGHSVGRLIDNDHFELCYMQTSEGDEQMVASCVVFERQ